MNDFSELINLIEANPSNWQSILKNKPYSLRSIKQSAQNPNWYILMYNLFERNSLKYKEVLASRGTVVEVKDGKAKIICAPFYKFFNFKEGLEEKIDFSNPKCFCCQKKDGWILKMAKVDGKLYWFTQSMDLIEENSVEVEALKINGLSFKNIYEVWKYAWERENHDFVESLSDGCTLIFELESAWNKIHTESQIEPKLWFIGFRGPDLMEKNIYDAKKEFNIPFETPEIYPLNSWEEIEAELSKWKGTEKEGVVVCEPTESGHFKRVKIKCEDYLRIKMIACAGEIVPTTRNIFNLVMKGEYDDFLSNEKLGPLILNMSSRIEAVKSKLFEIYSEMMKNIDMSKSHDLAKIDCVNWIKKNYGNINNGVIFSAFNCSSFEDAWNSLMDNWRYATKIAWKKFISYEESLNLTN